MTNAAPQACVPMADVRIWWAASSVSATLALRWHAVERLVLVSITGPVGTQQRGLYLYHWSSRHAAKRPVLVSLVQLACSKETCIGITGPVGMQQRLVLVNITGPVGTQQRGLYWYHWSNRHAAERPVLVSITGATDKQWRGLYWQVSLVQLTRSGEAAFIFFSFFSSFFFWKGGLPHKHTALPHFVLFWALQLSTLCPIEPSHQQASLRDSCICNCRYFVSFTVLPPYPPCLLWFQTSTSAPVTQVSAWMASASTTRAVSAATVPVASPWGLTGAPVWVSA